MGVIFDDFWGHFLILGVNFDDFGGKFWMGDQFLIWGLQNKGLKLKRERQEEVIPNKTC